MFLAQLKIFWPRFVVGLLLVTACSSLKNQMDHSDAEFREYMNEFSALGKQFPGPVPSSVQLRGKDKPHAVVGCMVHGDEFGCLPAILKLIKRVSEKKIDFQGTLTVFIGNPEAAGKQRFIEQDLNRVFLNEAPESLEKRRAKQLMPLLKTADVFIDLHQTIEPTDRPFYTFAFDPLNFYWAQYLEGADALVTRKAGTRFAANSLSGDEYVSQFGIPAITLESSQKGFSKEAEERDFHTLTRALMALRKMKNSRDIEEIKALASSSPQLKLFKRVYNQPFFSQKISLNPGFKNFSSVTQGMQVGKNADGTPLLAPLPGFLLFPKYPKRDSNGAAAAPVPSDLFLLIQEGKVEEFVR